MPNVPLTERLKGALTLASKYDLETLADDGHLRISDASNALARPSKVCPVSLLPVLKRTIAFTLCGRELCRDLIVCNNIDLLCLNDAKRRLGPVGDDAQVASLWQGYRCCFEGPDQPGRCSLRAGQNKLSEFIGASFVVIEVEGLEEARSWVFGLRLNEGLPERSDVSWDVHVPSNE